MSFILHLFHAPQVLTVAQAVARVDEGGAGSDADRARHARFCSAIGRSYPDLAADDVDGDDDRNVWRESFTSAGDVGAVFTLAPKTRLVEMQLLGHVALAAAAADLHVLDPQNAMLYRPDRMLVHDDGRSEPLRTPPPRLVAAPRPAPDSNFTAAAVAQRLHGGLCERFAKQGFVPLQPLRWGCAARTVGDVRQLVRFHVHDRSGELAVAVGITLHCPRIAQVWQQALGDDVLAYLGAMSQMDFPHPDFQTHSNELVLPPSEAATAYGESRYHELRSLAEVDAWFAAFCRWFGGEGLAALDTLHDPAGLARVFLADRQRERLYYRNDLLPAEQFSRLVLIGAFGDFRGGGWAPAWWDHFGRSGEDRKFKDHFPSLRATLERLIAHLDTAAFAAQARRLRGA